MKGDGLNKGEEFLYKLSLNKNFINNLKTIRKSFGIPKNGFEQEKQRQKWFKEKGSKGFGILEMILHLQKKYDIPLAYLFGLNDYLFFNEYRSGEWERFDPAVLLPPEHILNDEDIDLEEFYKDNKEPYVKLLILSNSKKTDVIKFIRNNWERVEEILKRQNWTPKDRVRKTIYKKRNRYIKELLQKPIKELQKKVGETICTDKDILINLILQKEGFGNVNEGYIRKMNTKNTK